MPIQRSIHPMGDGTSASRRSADADVTRLVVDRNAPALIALVGNWDLLHEASQDTAFKLATAGKLRIIVGGNRFSFHRFPLYLGPRLYRLRELMDNFMVSRAETCFQMLDTLENLDLDGTPLLVMDFLYNFDVDGMTSRELNRVLSECLRGAQKAAALGPVILGLANNQGDQSFVERVIADADHVVVVNRLEVEGKPNQGNLL